MTAYRVTVAYTVYDEYTVDAESEELARVIVLDGGCRESLPWSDADTNGDLEVIDVSEVLSSGVSGDQP